MLRNASKRSEREKKRGRYGIINHAPWRRVDSINRLSAQLSNVPTHSVSSKIEDLGGDRMRGHVAKLLDLGGDGMRGHVAKLLDVVGDGMRGHVAKLCTQSVN